MKLSPNAAPRRALPSRRGSFLVLVVGMLALLAVIAIIYVSIGNQDLRTRSALARQDRLEEVPRGAAEYITNIIGEDALATRFDYSGPEGRLPGNGPIIQTRENTDYPSILLNARSDLSMATATQIPFDPVGRYEAMIAGGNVPDVWPSSDPFLASSEASFIYDGTANTVPRAQHYLLRMDWANITNVAPDGRFVNLFNLRNNINAQAGTGAGRMSEFLTLFNADGSPASQTDWGTSLDPNIPAHFSMRQRFAFRPMGSWPTAFGVGDAAYPPYQWADTDGDGMFDARWFEGTDSRDNTLRRIFGEGDSRYRYFFAVRVVDLSARVNLNTATDQRIAPDAVGVAGFSPADVDLRRLLSGYDSFEMYQGSPVPLGFAGMPQPGGGRIDDYSLITAPIQFNAGTWGYEALRMAHAAGVTPPASLAPGAQFPAAFANYLNPLTLNPADWNFKSGEPRIRTSFYQRRALGSIGAYAVAGGQIDSRAGYDLDSLAELLTRNSVNDPSVTSAVEQTLGGRADPGADPGRQYSPVRDNRSLDTETARPLANGMPRADVMHMLATDPRQRLTTISGAAPRRAARGVQGELLTSADVLVDARTLLQRISSAPVANQEPLRDLFRAYADALMPFSDVADAWRGRPETSTLFYGHRGPLLAALTAAHMSVNMADSFDTNGTPTVSTLLFNNDQANVLNNDITQTPAQQLFPGWSLGNGMYLTDSRAANNAAGLAFDAINVYGVEAQPFVTHIATFTAYADEPGASDFEGSGQEIEIKGDLDLMGNKEYLYSGVFFQLTNPFGRDVTLSRNTWTVDGGVWQNADYYDQGDANIPEADRESDYYYLRWAGRNYKLAALREQTFLDRVSAQDLQNSGVPAMGDDSRIGQYVSPVAGSGLDITASGITIPAGGTIVCYVLTESPQKILERFRAVDPTLVAGGVGSMRSTVINVIQNDIRANASSGISGVYWIGAIDDATGRYDFTTTPAAISGTGAPNQAVELWRSVRVDAERQSQALTPPSLFWDGQTSSNAPSLNFYVRNVRENDQLMDRFRIPAGVDLKRKLPDGDNKVQGTDADNDNDGYALTLWAAARRPSDPATSGQVPRGAFPGYCIEPKYNAGWNHAEPGNLLSATLDDSDFSTSLGVGESVQEWRNVMENRGLIASLAQDPSQTTSPRMTQAPRAIAADPDTGNYANLYPEIVIDNERFERVPTGAPGGTPASSTLRPLDLLLPMGIGPTSNFLIDHTVNPNARWTTLGEAMAAAMGYEGTAADFVDTNDHFSVLLRPNPATPSRKMYDRGGNLRLDDFVLFLDRNANGVFDTTGGTPDIHLGAGIPAALTIPDIFYVSPVAQRAPSLTRIEPGLININTAPVEVARMIPMLTPPPPSDPLGGAWWWWTGAAHDQRADIAATMVAYRDKNDVYVRPQNATATTYGVVTYFDTEQFTNPPAAKTRGTYARVPALRESLGFSGTGELLACRNIPDPTVAGDYELPWSIDYLGYDGRATGSPTNSSRIGVDSVLYDNAGAAVVDELRNEYKEKLAIANAALPSMTTRSDVFAVWFVVHGYQKSDVDNLTNTQPLVPSIARRFVMVVDRSNVVQKGQRPNILLLREVPYN